MNNTLLQNKQKDKHAKESHFIEFLRSYAEIESIQFEDVHDNLKTGIDVYYDGKPYDLKVSNSLKLSLFRTSDLYGGETRCPMLIHPEIPYLYVVEKDDKFIGFVIDKKELLKPNFLNATTFGEFTGDGNYNLTIDLNGCISDVATKILTWMKPVSVGTRRKPSL